MTMRFSEGKLYWEESGFAPGIFLFRCDDGEYSSAALSWSGGRGILPNGLEVEVGVSGDNSLRLRFTNGTGPVFLRQVVLEFPPSLPVRDYREYSHCGIHDEVASGVKFLGRATDKIAAAPLSYLAYMWSGPQQLLLAELPEFGGDIVEFQAVFNTPGNDDLAGIKIFWQEDRSVASGAEFVSTPVIFRREDRGYDPLDMLDELGEIYSGARKFPLKPPVCGWNSYSNRGLDIFPEYILDNERRLLDFSGGRINCFVTDDGWQICYGAWQANPKFADGMKSFCARVISGGGVPGIWTAPLLLDAYYMFPKTWRLWNAKYNRWILDVSRPEVLEHLGRVYRELKAMGFRYFKIDFTVFLLTSDRPHDLSRGRGGVLRGLYRTIRDAVGWDSYLMGCGCVMDAAFGIMDAARTAADNSGFWSSVDVNMCTTAARWWQNRRFWNNDPDYIEVRGPDTSAETEPGYVETVTPYRRGVMRSGPRNNESEAAAFALFIYMCGGELVFGDHFAWLNERGRAIMRRVLALEPLSAAARPVDMFTSPGGDVPMFWFERGSGKLAVFNPLDRERTFHIRGSEFGKKFSSVFWDEKRADISFDNDDATLVLPPHCAVGIV